MKYLKKSIQFLLSITLFFCMVGCQQDNVKVQKEFDQFLNQEFIETMENDYVTLHTYVTHPEDFGIDMSQVEVGLGMGASQDDQQKLKQELNDTYEQLMEFDYDNLTEDQKDSYDIYKTQLSIDQKLSDEKFDYYGSLFASMTGLHYQYPTLLTDWDIRNEEDLQNMIIMVKDILPYTQEALDYTKTQAQKGLLMIDFDSVLTYCQRILDQKDHSPVLQAVYENIENLDITKQKKEDYKQQMEDAFQTSFFPAYQEIITTLSHLKDGTNNEQGLAHFKDGKEYYALLLQQNSGTDQTVEEVKNMMEDAFHQHMQRLVVLAIQNPELYEDYTNGNFPQTNFQSYDEILKFIKQNLSQDFPEVDQLSYQIQDVNENLASDSGVTAYFNIPTLDGTQVKQLRVNPKTNDVKTISTYATVAHEGLTGHMYQYAYMYENQTNNFRKAIASCQAYSEGYATYAQYECLKYLADKIDEDVLQLYKEAELLNNSLTILIDIGIHYEGWSQSDVLDFLEDNGMVLDEESLSALYKQLQANPAAFVPYYVGYEKIAQMKEEAQETLGDNFDHKLFHEALLETGTAPFDVVERHIDRYVENSQ